MTAPSISVVVPLHNEEMVLPQMLRRVSDVLDAMPGGPHEMIFVDDGSSDATAQMLEAAAAADPRMVVIILSRNFGHQPALSAALDYASGDVTVVLDGDLQDPPESIPALVAKFQEGYDVVYAQRKRRKEGPLLKLAFYVFYRLMSSMSDTRLPLDAGDFGLMSRRVVNLVRSMPEHHRYIRGMRSWVGFRQIGIPVERSERAAGESKYGFLKYIKLASDAIFSFSTIPIRAAAFFGFIAISVSVLFALYTLVAKLAFHQPPKGFTALLVIGTFLAGTVLFFLGVIGEYVGRVYEEVKARPLYIVHKVIGRPAQARSNSSAARVFSGSETDRG
ncbi:MAG TPA: glycosyltransferase family 2 protein [Candidatus Acidoferrum sp.]